MRVEEAMIIRVGVMKMTLESSPQCPKPQYPYCAVAPIG